MNLKTRRARCSSSGTLHQVNTSIIMQAYSIFHAIKCVQSLNSNIPTPNIRSWLLLFHRRPRSLMDLPDDKKIPVVKELREM